MRNRYSIAVAAAALAIAAVSCRGGQLPAAAEVVAVSHAAPMDPADQIWRSAPVHVAPLILQDMVEPRLMNPSTTQVRVQAAADGQEIAFRLEWVDATRDDTQSPARFSDACAVQLPVRIEADAPAPQMGETGRPVQITYWRAVWQAIVDGRPDGLESLYPDAAVDHYPFDSPALQQGSPEQQAMANRYSPARALGNDMAGPRATPVQDLIAAGPGSLQPAGASRSNGRGVRTKDGWAVVLKRPIPAGFAPGSRSQVAFAVLQGSEQEAGARKMRTGWIQMSMEAPR